MNINTDKPTPVINNFSYIGGCGFLHPFNAEKKAACEANRREKQSTKNLDDQADFLLAQAAADKSAQPSSSWTAGKTAMVIGISLIGLTIMIVVIKKVANRKK